MCALPKGHIPETQFLTLELKFEALDTWPKDTRIVFYSNAGHRSLEVASYFMALSSVNYFFASATTISPDQRQLLFDS